MHSEHISLSANIQRERTFLIDGTLKNTRLDFTWFIFSKQQAYGSRCSLTSAYGININEG